MALAVLWGLLPLAPTPSVATPELFHAQLLMQKTAVLPTRASIGLRMGEGRPWGPRALDAGSGSETVALSTSLLSC